MKLIIIDRKAWERHHSEFADFIHSIEQLIGNPPETDEWLDNEAVCKRFGHQQTHPAIIQRYG